MWLGMGLVVLLVFWIGFGMPAKAFKAVLRGCFFWCGFIWFKADSQIWLAGFIHNQNLGIWLALDIFFTG